MSKVKSRKCNAARRESVAARSAFVRGSGVESGLYAVELARAEAAGIVAAAELDSENRRIVVVFNSSMQQGMAEYLFAAFSLTDLVCSTAAEYARFESWFFDEALAMNRAVGISAANGAAGGVIIETVRQLRVRVRELGWVE